MSLIHIVKLLFELDARTMISVLIWGDFALAVLAFGYERFHAFSIETKKLHIFGSAKVLQGFAWLLLFLRAEIPDILSITLGNIILYISFYIESVLMLQIVGTTKKIWYYIQKAILIVVSLLFISIDYVARSSNIRIALSSIMVFLLLLIPTFFYVFDKESSKFRRYLGIYIITFLFFLIPRGFISFFDNDSNLFSNTLIQSGTFINLILLLFINGTGYLLLLYEKADKMIRDLSVLDPLTRIYNRRFFMEKAEQYFLRHKRSRLSIAFIFMDIDHFKGINDTYGHQLGDEVLKNLASNVKNVIRPSDLCCRYGGEEFLVMLNETNLQEGMQVAERIRESIRDSIVTDELQIQYTISAGICAGIPEENSRIEQYIEKGDQAMYQSKKEGRNRVTAYNYKS